MPLKVTLADFWDVINEAIPTLLNQKNIFHKHVRSLILYTEYFRRRIVLDSFELDKKMDSFKTYRDVLAYVQQNVPAGIQGKIRNSYLKRFFYTQAGYYKDLLEYDAQRFLYDLAHEITRGCAHG